MEAGLRVTVRPKPLPDADKATGESKPPETAVVIVEVTETPPETLMDAGEALIVKLGEVPVTVNVTLVDSVVPPEVPFTVIEYVPVAVEDATLSVMLEVPAPVIDDWLNVTVTPDGWPDTDRAIGESKPPVAVLVMVEVPELP